MDKFKIGDKVWIKCRDYAGESGIVTSFKTNLFGTPLVIVRRDNSESTYKPCFYFHELRKIEQ